MIWTLYNLFDNKDGNEREHNLRESSTQSLSDHDVPKTSQQLFFILENITNIDENPNSWA